MAVQPQTPYIEHIANGTTTGFNLGFDCDDQDHLIVLVNDVEPVFGSWSLTGGAVVFGAAPTSGNKITIQRNTPFERKRDYQSYDNSFRPPVVNKDFDWIWFKLQELGVADWILGNRIDALKEYVDQLNTNLQEDIDELESYVDQKDKKLQENIDNLKTYVDDKDDELRSYLVDEIRKQGVALDQLDEYYNYLMQRLAQIAVDKGWDASFVVDSSGLTQQQITDASIYNVGSIVEMQSLSDKFYSRVIKIKATQAMYQYLPENAAINDGFRILNGWTLIGYKDRLLATLADLKGDATNEYTKLNRLFTVASAIDIEVNLCGLNIHTSNIIATGNLKIVGKGSIILISGAMGTLITSAFNLECGEGITLDQNKINNASGPVTSESDCTIKHTGDNLILRGTKFKPSASMNIHTKAQKKILCENLGVDGGMVGLYAIPRPDAKVEVIGGEYKNSTLYDNIQILNGSDITTERITSRNPARSGIVISNSTAKARIFGNFCTGGKTDGANQGGWGIVASVNSQDSTVGLNICLNNQRGGISVDTYPDSGGSVDNRISVFGNILGGKFNDVYATTGLGLNNAKHSNVTGNIIFSVNQGILAVDADYSSVTGNTIMDTTEFAHQFFKSPNAVFKNNIVDGCSVTGAAALRFIDSPNFVSQGNTIRNLTGAAGFAYRVSGTSKNWLIRGDDIIRDVTGSGYLFHILGAGNTGGKIRDVTATGNGVAGWQWYIVSDNLAQFSTHDNELESVGTGYITSGANVTAGDDTINGSRNYWATTPVAFKSRIGQIATIANIQKVWNGTDWVSANAVSVVYDPPSIAAGASVNTNVTVTGAQIGDFAQASFSIYDANIEISAVVSGANLVTVKFKNISAAAIDLASGALRVKVS